MNLFDVIRMGYYIVGFTVVLYIYSFVREDDLRLQRLARSFLPRPSAMPDSPGSFIVDLLNVCVWFIALLAWPVALYHFEKERRSINEKK